MYLSKEALQIPDKIREVWYFKNNNSNKTFWQQATEVRESESRSVVSNSLQPHGPYSPWNSPGQNTGVGSLYLLQGIFPAQGSNQASRIAGRFFTSWAIREAQEYWSR